MADHLPSHDEPPIAWRRVIPPLSRILRRRRHDRHEGAALVARAELHIAVSGGEQRVVLAHADIFAGIELGAALAHDDVAGRNDLAAEKLHAEPLARAVAPVARGAAGFLMRHGCAPSSRRPR